MGIYGMDFYVILARPGYGVRYRRKRKSKVGFPHRLVKEDGMRWFQQQVSINLILCTHSKEICTQFFKLVELTKNFSTQTIFKCTILFVNITISVKYLFT